MTKILAIGAHPDDIEIGCGGTLALHRIRGDEIHKLIMSKGRDDEIDQKFDTIPLVDIITPIEDIIASYRPKIIYTHCSSDINKDHRIVNEAVLVATRPLGSMREIYAFDVTSDWGFGQFGSFKPNVFVDITATMGQKILAIQAYVKEIRTYPHYRSLRKIKALAERWGAVINTSYAEAFELIRWIK